MDGSPIRKEKVADSKISGYVWTGPKSTVKQTLLLVDLFFLATNLSILDVLGFCGIL